MTASATAPPASRRQMLATLSAAAGLAGCGRSASASPLRVFAASSLTDAVTRLAEAFAAMGGLPDPPALTFAGSATLARQIADGAPADVFLSADTEWVDYLAARGMVRSDSRRVFASNRLVLAAPASSGLVWTATVGDDLAARLGEGRLAMADPDSVPAGRYARAALESLGQWEAFPARAVRTANVREALRLVELGEVEAALVFATDVAAAGARVCTVVVLPDSLHPPIRYELATLQRAHPAADAFAGFVAGAEGCRVLGELGFVVDCAAPGD